VSVRSFWAVFCWRPERVSSAGVLFAAAARAVATALTRKIARVIVRDAGVAASDLRMATSSRTRIPRGALSQAAMTYGLRCAKCVSADPAAVPIRPGRAVSDRDAIEAAAVREAPGRSIAGAHGVRQETAALSGF
jgi:hypothetical protein